MVKDINWIIKNTNPKAINEISKRIRKSGNFSIPLSIFFLFVYVKTKPITPIVKPITPIIIDIFPSKLMLGCGVGDSVGIGEGVTGEGEGVGVGESVGIGVGVYGEGEGIGAGAGAGVKVGKGVGAKVVGVGV